MGALWSRTTKNPDVSIWPLARQFAHSLTLLTHLLALHFSHHSRAPLRSFVCLLTPELAGDKAVLYPGGVVNQWDRYPFVRAPPPGVIGKEILEMTKSECARRENGQVT